MQNMDLYFCDGVRHLYVPGLNKVSLCSKDGLRIWLGQSDSFIPSDSDGTDNFKIVLYDMADVLSAWASDINRLSCAAIETVANISYAERNKKFIAWNLVSYYYSAFYSAHSLLKIAGFGLTQIDDDIIRHIKRKYSALGMSNPQMTSGMYCVNFNLRENSLRFYKVKRYNDSHRGLWQRFTDFLNVLMGISVVSGSYDSNCIRMREQSEPYPLSLYSRLATADANTIISRLDELKKYINKRGDNNQLSFVRNRVNYNHSFGVWYPYQDCGNAYEHIVDMANLWKKNPLSSDFKFVADQEILVFARCCQLINSLNYDVLIDLNSRHPENKSFLRNGVMSYIKHFAL